MARKIRIEYPGAVYHVMSRGDHQEAIYRDDADRVLFLKCLDEACEKTGWQIHASVLMGNHYHLLLETPQANLVVGMKWLQGTYTQRFNSRHKLYGHLFQGRYKALNVDEEDRTQFQVVSTYIHLNPVRAGLVRREGEPLRVYRWSSYPAYLAPPRQRPPWLRVDRVLGSLGISADDSQGRRGYEAYMEKDNMAWWLRCQTTLPRKWIAQRLGMGHETRVTLAVRVVSVTNRGRLAHLRQQIEGL